MIGGEESGDLADKEGMAKAVSGFAAQEILVTGGAGFIGNHLCQALAGAGHQVRVIDLNSPAERVPGVSYEVGDVRDKLRIQRLVKDVQVVYHLSATESGPACQQDPMASYKNNFSATCQVLEAVSNEQDHQKRPVRVIFGSSGAVYGCPTAKKALAEKQVALWPSSFYAAQKLGSEQAIRLYHQTRGIPALVLRFFNVYGPGDAGVVGVFSRLLEQGQALPLFGGGMQTRDFVSVHDIVRACMAALELPDTKCDAEAINLGTGKGLSIRQLAAEMIKAAKKKKTKLEKVPARPGDALHFVADVRRAKQLLKWSAQVRLKDGLRELFPEPVSQAA